MSTTIKISDHLYETAKRYAGIFSRSVPKQIEHWTHIGQIAEENPDLPYEIISDILIGLDQMKRGEVKPYKPGDFTK